VHNLCDGSTLEDTLHHRAVKSQPCRPKVCQSSVAMPKSLVAEPSRNPTPSQDLLVQAVEFINQYYNSLKTPKTEEHLARVEAVAAEIDATGTYQLTEEELAFGAKHAWRNAARCIGRIQWANLHVFDARKCRTTRDMFRFLCGHMRFATNGGNLRWVRSRGCFCLFLMQNGAVRSKPVYTPLAFPKLCAQLGWTPRYGRFDVLPLVLQANGGDPEIFEIPPELVLEVPMEHPQYEWFQELQLRWYALPAVSNMLLEMGGLEFPGCPFNGWYMGTEIGVRDLCDSQRYNILEQVGRRMGLEIHNLSSLWKDQALVAINVAVIHSFQHNVTITDHHSAAESFIRHMQAEFKLRGGCPADWTWLVPPMSGSLTPVFHQEMVNYVLSPYFYYQVPLLFPRLSTCRFPSCRAALFCSLLMHQAMTARVRSTVLYATETGKSQALAKKLNSMLNCAFSSRVLCMEDYNPGDLEKEDFLAVVTSTFGNGDAPENGKVRVNSRQSSCNCTSCVMYAVIPLIDLIHFHEFSQPPGLLLARYCVFGLGSRVYPRFCAFAHEVDAKLEDLGGRRVTPTGEGDELDGQEEAFSAWAGAAFKVSECWTWICDSTYQPDVLVLQYYRWHLLAQWVLFHVSCPVFSAALSSIHSKAVLPMKLKRRQNLNSSKSSRATILVVLESEGDVEGVRCLPGEHIGVFPGNPARLVTGILKHLLDAPPTNQSLRLEYHFDYDGDKSWQTDKHIPACTLSQALTYFLDITAPPVQSLLYKLSQLAGQEGHRQQLLTLDSKQYCAWKEFHRPTFLDVLEEFPSLAITTTFLLSQLPMLKPRLYSMSSSPDLHPRELHLTVAVVKYQTQDGHGPLHHGVCSTWMNTIKEGDMVPCFIHRSSGFHLPPESSIPAILVGAGSGIAPFRSFWQQRRLTCEVHHLYSEETLEMKRQGVLKNVLPAYSRQPGQPKVYVQDVLRKQLAGEVVRILHQSSGHLYVCGNVEMVHDVACAVQEILGRELDMSSAQAREYLIQLKTEKRFHEDIFGSVERNKLRKKGSLEFHSYFNPTLALLILSRHNTVSVCSL
uniref:Nitric oxide synthase n=1 Tax=Scleropages formosus TaxID=113540 RepID=A0A8C9STY3_SCLFO